MGTVMKKDESVLSAKDKETLARNLKKLEEFYPEHKTFAMDALCSQQRETCSKLSKKLGYSNFDEFLLAYGFEPIKGSEVYEVRKNCGIKPGDEPELIKERVDNAIISLHEYYPDHTIIGSFNKEHSNLFSKLTGFYQWLGYKSMEDMLAAYGFKYIAKKGRKPTVDSDTIIAELKMRYPEGIAMTVGELREANKDLAAGFKSLMNKSNELFGMSFGNYLKEQGILLPVERIPSRSVEEKREYIKEYNKERRTADSKEYLEESIKYYQRAYLGWKPLPKSAESLMQTHVLERSKRKIKNYLEGEGYNPDEFFKPYGIISSEETDNELRKNIQYLDFNLLSGELNLPFDKKEFEVKKEQTEENIAIDHKNELDNVIRELEERLSKGDEKVDTIGALEKKYRDLPIRMIGKWTKELLNIDAKDYLKEKGILLSAREKYLSRIDDQCEITISGKWFIFETGNNNKNRVASLKEKVKTSGGCVFNEKDHFSLASFFVVDPNNNEIPSNEYKKLDYYKDQIKIISFDYLEKFLDTVKEREDEKNREKSLAAEQLIAFRDQNETKEKRKERFQEMLDKVCKEAGGDYILYMESEPANIREAIADCIYEKYYSEAKEAIQEVDAADVYFDAVINNGVSCLEEVYYDAAYAIICAIKVYLLPEFNATFSCYGAYEDSCIETAEELGYERPEYSLSGIAGPIFDEAAWDKYSESPVGMKDISKIMERISENIDRWAVYFLIYCGATEMLNADLSESEIMSLAELFNKGTFAESLRIELTDFLTVRGHAEEFEEIIPQCVPAIVLKEHRDVCRNYYKYIIYNFPKCKVALVKLFNSFAKLYDSHTEFAIEALTDNEIKEFNSIGYRAVISAN